MQWWQKPFMRALIVFSVTILILILRRPDIILYPQPWAEDGLLWISSAHNVGALRSLFIPIAGYFQTISRIAGALTTFFPLEWAPAIFNAIALSVRALPVVLLFSNRYTALIPRLETKMLLAAVYVLLPNSEEFLANVTNAHSYLALLSMMTILAPAPATRAQKVTDALTYGISALSGPFILLMYPIFAILAFVRGVKSTAQRYWLPMSLGCVQLLSMLLNFGERSSMPLGATLELFIEITVKQVIFGSFLGTHQAWPIYQLMAQGSVFGWGIAIALCIGVSGLLVYGWPRYTLEFKLFMLFALLAYMAALAKPMASFTQAQWPILALLGAGMHYWFFPTLVCMMIVIFNLEAKKPARYVAYGLFAVWCIGVVGSFRVNPWPNLQYVEQIKAFRASSESSVEIQIMPPGWIMPLNKN